MVEVGLISIKPDTIRPKRRSLTTELRSTSKPAPVVCRLFPQPGARSCCDDAYRWGSGVPRRVLLKCLILTRATSNLLALNSAIWGFLFRQKKSARRVRHGVRFVFHPTAALSPCWYFLPGHCGLAVLKGRSKAHDPQRAYAIFASYLSATCERRLCSARFQAAWF